jgi:hypothetical protein
MVVLLSALKSPSMIGYKLDDIACCVHVVTVSCVSLWLMVLVDERYTEIILNLKSCLKNRSIAIAPPGCVIILCI